MPAKGAILLNLLLYQIGWFCCVLGAARDRPLLGGLGALLLIAIHLGLARAPWAEIRLLAVAALLGTTVDGLQQALGVFTFKADPAWPLPIPFWVPVIWAQFATLFHFSLRWLSGRFRLAALLGMAGGPLAYGAGIRLGAAELGAHPLQSIITLALVWAVVTPALVWLGDRTEKGPGGYRGFRN